MTRGKLLTATVAGSLVGLCALAGPASADPVLPSPAPSETPSSTPSGAASATPSATPNGAVSSTPSEAASSASRPPSSAPTSERQQKSAASTADDFTLIVKAVGSPQTGRFFEDIGSFGLSGGVADRQPGQKVEIWRSADGGKSWSRLVSTSTRDDRSYATSSPVTATGSGLRFCATLGGSPASTSVVKTCAAAVTVADSGVRLTSTFRSINALKDPVVTGTVYPARAGVRVNVDVYRDKKYRAAVTATSAANGTWRATLAWGHGSLTDYRIRAAYKATNRARWEVSSSLQFTRVAVLDAKIAKTTAADVAKTYRSGCPVGPSKLRTISLNYYAMDDHKLHRGVIIIRSDLSDDLVRAFGAALAKRYPIAKINNPNVYGGNDPKQMEANNTSGFNCRKVTGNPYAQSPHSYGTALDVNTVQNPYRDVHGKWWPKNGKSYIDRSPLKAGMLSKNSTLTKSLRKDKFFWGGFWNPGRDYQHFQR